MDLFLGPQFFDKRALHRETLTQRRWGNVNWGLRYRVVLSCRWISELPSSQWTQYQHLLLRAEGDTNRLNAVAGRMMGEKGHTSQAQRTAVRPCAPKCSLWTLRQQPAADTLSASCSCWIQTDTAYRLYPLIGEGHSDRKYRCDLTLVNDANKYGRTWRSLVNGARLRQIHKCKYECIISRTNMGWPVAGLSKVLCLFIWYQRHENQDSKNYNFVSCCLWLLKCV